VNDLNRIAQLEEEIDLLKARLRLVETARREDGIVKIDVDKRLVGGWAYVAKRRDGSQVIDWSGDVVSDAGNLEDAAYQFVEKSRNGDVDHSRVPVATLVESMVFTPDKLEKIGVPEGVLPAAGWWTTFRVNDEATWQRVKRGELKAFSVGGKGQRIDLPGF
jgi:Putative phage serine protease XkdF